MKYKGTYRLKPNLDQFTNDFPRTEDENIDPSYDDIYIKCANNSQIYHYGHSTLVAYIPSIGRGHNVLIAIAKRLQLIKEDTECRDYAALYQLLQKNGTVYDIIENDTEIEFKFNAKNIELIAEFMKPQTSGADISPFSQRNLPKSSYVIPTEDLQEYKSITDYVPQDRKLSISHITNAFMNDILSKDRLYRTVNMKTDMRKKMMKQKEYIHSMGYWNKYLKYLKDNL